jgi:hypothetical protein
VILGTGGTGMSKYGDDTKINEILTELSYMK